MPFSFFPHFHCELLFVFNLKTIKEELKTITTVTKESTTLKKENNFFCDFFVHTLLDFYFYFIH